ncbi:MAG: hypothetical protein ACOYMF_17940 [Bacteroidales bacterium]
MKTDYNNREQRIYSEYAPKTDQQLLAITKNRKNYIPEVIEIVADILAERGLLPDHIIEEKRTKAEESRIEAETQKIINYGTDLLFKQNKSPEESVQILVANGLEISTTEKLINDLLLLQASESKKKAVNNDVLYGAIWFFGGIAATVADLGYIFWGAIVFGGYQLIRGLKNS